MYSLGRHVEHDPASRGFAAAKAVVLKSVEWTFHGTVLDQGQVGSCTGNAAVDSLMTGPYFDHLGKVFTEADALSVYELATRIDTIPGSYPPNDTGSSGLAAMKACQLKGWISGYQHAFGLDHALGALQLGPVITGITWYNDMFTPDANGFVSLTGSVAGGHEIAVVGYDSATAAVKCLNSWGAGWGLGGFFWLKASDWGSLLANNGDVTVPVMLKSPCG